MACRETRHGVSTRRRRSGTVPIGAPSAGRGTGRTQPYKWHAIIGPCGWTGDMSVSLVRCPQLVSPAGVPCPLSLARVTSPSTVCGVHFTCSESDESQGPGLFELSLLVSSQAPDRAGLWR